MTNDQENKEAFYATLVYILLNKFCNNHILISREEWDKTRHKELVIKHRLNADNLLEVVTFIEDEVN